MKEEKPKVIREMEALAEGMPTYVEQLRKENNRLQRENETVIEKIAAEIQNPTSETVKSVHLSSDGRYKLANFIREYKRYAGG